MNPYLAQAERLLMYRFKAGLDMHTRSQYLTKAVEVLIRAHKWVLDRCAETQVKCDQALQSKDIHDMWDARNMCTKTTAATKSLHRVLKRLDDEPIRIYQLLAAQTDQPIPTPPLEPNLYQQQVIDQKELFSS